MKVRFTLIFCLVICSFSLLAADDFPASKGTVSDFAGVMESGDVRFIESLATALEQKTGAELMVVTVQTFAPYGSIEDYAVNLFNAWGIGQAGQDNGVLLILAVEDREVKIETGYGLEGAIPDSMAGRILDNAVLPLFKDNHFSGGLVQGAQAIAAAVAKDKGISAEEIEQLGVSASAAEAIERKGLGSFLYFLLIVGAVFVIAVIWMIILFRRLGVGGGGGYSGSSSNYSHSSESSSSSGGGRSGGGGASRKF
ncbi:MAG: TPM domain-containing protein [Treponema sp.]|jgi:uncharacterized protein|nr:TPM domain-containing protein [Treponema sp.]